jgi:hypothetical protein
MLPILAQPVFFLYREKSGCDSARAQPGRGRIGYFNRIFGAMSAALAMLCTSGKVIAETTLASTAAPVAASAPPARWISVSRVVGRITSRDMGLVINTADPYSVEIGAVYAATRKIPESQILRVELPVKASLTSEEFQALAHV